MVDRADFEGSEPSLSVACCAGPVFNGQLRDESWCTRSTSLGASGQHIRAHGYIAQCMCGVTVSYDILAS